MDNILLCMMLIFSVFWAAVFNSVDSPMLNQPIKLEIDYARNLNQISGFFAYFIQIFLTYASAYALYWINHHVLIDHVMAKHGVWNYLWVTILFTVCLSPLLSYLALMLPINSNAFTLLPSGNQDPFDTVNLQVAFAIIFFSSPFLLAFKWQKQEASIAKLKQETTQAELKWLQQQINPHFLFNTLNNLYSLTLTKSEQAPDCILKLASLLRFVVYQGGKERVSLTEELGYLRDYIALQELRVSHKAKITLELEEQLLSHQQWRIAPLLLVIPIENAFKHGVDVSDQASWCQIKIALTGNCLRLTCINSVSQNTLQRAKRIGQMQSKEDESGLGLENLTRRLELMYKGRYSFQTYAGEHEFRAELMIELGNDESVKCTNN